MKVMTRVEELAGLPHGARRGAVFTMGALHAGHVSLMKFCRAAIGADGLLIVTVFVNPTQFNDPRDLEKYPRTLEADLAVCESAGVDVVFAPSVDEMYPPSEPVEEFFAHALGGQLEGASRPGHFDAVATVVHRLLQITAPDVTCFGEKDYQQLQVVRRMVADAGMAVDVIGVPTVRDTDGVALSSRNQLLAPNARAAAALIPQALEVLSREAAAGSVESAVAAGLAVLAGNPQISVDYLTIRAVDLGPAPSHGAARALIAVTIDGIRLIDNIPLNIGGVS